MMLNAEVVPEIFFSLGEQVHHFLIDEFQDTSPIQWAILRPLVENALGGTGSLFLVGDTKQSIYTFRGADWRIMRRMVEREEFPSVQSRKLSLGTNYRSAEAVVEFSKQVFHRCVPELISRDVCDLSGLASYQQEVQEEKRGTGYVEVRSVPPATDDEEDERRENPPEREHLLRILAECRSRGYGYGDIAILTPRNKHVVEVSRWLNAAGIRFISHSSLDIRTRKLTGELLALLQFLDSPVNDLAFATFLLGNIFATSTPELKGQQIQAFILRARKAESPRAPLYRQFRTAFGGIWNRLFEHLFNVIGYLPVYDLVAEVYKTFDLFNVHPDEEATLVKFLEVIKNFEESGSNSLKDFLAYAERDEREESDEWNIPTGESEDAVRIMTVHKAKGLGFPILVTLFYDHRVKPDNRFLVGEGEGVKLIHVTSAESKNSVELAAYYKEARAFAEVDELNKLYVSLTRAREELYIISVQNTWGKYPSQFFPQDGFKLGQPSRKQRAEAVIGLTAERLHQPTRGFAQATTVDAAKLRETRRGELIHNVLSEIEYLDAAIERSIEQALVPWLRTMREPLDRAETKKLLLDFLQQPEVCQYFSAVSGRRVLNEQELVDNAGRLHRVDRLVIDEDVVTVLDYKTGEEHESHHAQVREYMQIVRELYPKKRVRGVLLYIDRTRVREVQ
jgi:ATP-dependent exoDNAse (exonuclease V) beta subunit